ncbi:MAG: AMP-binding protein [Actinomycetota bacterium]
MDPVAELLDAGRRRPLVVLDPSWPAAQRESAAADVAAAVASGRVGPDDLVLFTSGSTGHPRGVVRSLASWQLSLDPLSELTGIGADDVVWVPGPLTSSLSLYGTVHARTVGAEVVARPCSAVTAAHLVPSALARALDLADSLPELRTVVVAGDVLPDSLRRRAVALGWRVVEYYGAAELSFVGWRDSPGPFHDFPGARVRVQDGQVWVCSPYCCNGYLAPDDEGPLVRDGVWVGVGDLGRLEGDGWVVTGRGDAAVVTGGHTVVVTEVEAVIAAVPGVVAVAVVGLPHAVLGRYVAAVVVSDRPVRAGAVDAVRALPPAARPRRWFSADRLPLTPAGKVSRSEVEARAAALPPLR